MTGAESERAGEPEWGRQPDAPPPVLRAAFVGALIVLGVLLVVSARAEDPPAQARSSGRVDLVELIRLEEARVEALNARVEELTQQVRAQQQQQAPGQDVAAAVQAQLDTLRPAAGLTAVRGPGVMATLSDSSAEPEPGEDLNSYVIHEQDLQGVINALWSGGAEAMAVNGQRVLATTAIRCVGNTLLLHGGVYSPPYVVAAVGDPSVLRSALDDDPAVRRFVRAVDAYDLGWTLEDDMALELPAYEGAVARQVAEPAGEVAAG